MPRELPELKGEPLSWDGYLRLQQADGSEVLIEKAISVSDLCPPYTGQGTQHCLLCFFEGQGYGLCIAHLVTVEVEGRKQSHGISGGWETLKDVRERTSKGVEFLNSFHSACGINPEDVLKLLN